MLGLDCTVMSICHRITHVDRFDLVMILDEGQLVELGPPLALRRDPLSHYAAFLQSAEKD
jgi:ABC-type multidrug transport system fused ATPase/permease subunit